MELPGDGGATSAATGGSPGAVIGIVANPMSGRDIRRLVASASVFPNAEKINMVQRVLCAAAVVGVGKALLSTDMSGVSAGVLRAARSSIPGRDPAWPGIEFLEDELTGTANDTESAVRRMVDAGAGVIVCLGGDGTARVAAAACGEVPLLPLSTGTNNAFPQMREATVAGLAAGLVATGAVARDLATRRCSALRVQARNRLEIALVDVCVSTARHVGSRALWDPRELRELYCTFAEPDGIGLSSVPGLLCPSPRAEIDGVALRLCDPAEAPYVVHAPVAPGLVLPVGVAEAGVLASGSTRTVRTGQGVVAVDGEREIEFSAGDEVTVTLTDRGPLVLDIAGALRAAAERGLLVGAREQVARIAI